MGFGVWGLGIGVCGLGFGVWGLGLRVEGLARFELVEVWLPQLTEVALPCVEPLRPPESEDNALRGRLQPCAFTYSATRNRKLRWFSRCSQFTRISHVPGEGRPLLREGGPISYEATPSASFQPAARRGIRAVCRVAAPACVRE